jgi:16S rRNA (uracil1498-N3)-methyltransferase
LDFRISPHEFPAPFAVAMGILNSRERMEFALEKLTELGITDFYPLITDYAQTKEIDEKRLRQKMIAAMKQCRRSILPELHKPISISELHTLSSAFQSIFLADPKGGPIQPYPMHSTLILAGPEGGFSNNELEFIKSWPGIKLLRIGQRRLRAETAIIAAASVIQSAW